MGCRSPRWGHKEIKHFPSVKKSGYGPKDVKEVFCLFQEGNKKEDSHTCFYRKYFLL